MRDPFQNKIFSLLLFTILNCNNLTSNDDSIEIDLGDSSNLAIPDWTSSIHSNEVEPNYDEIFEEQTIKRIDISLSSVNWEAMQADLSINLTSSRTADVDFTPIWVPATITYEDTDWYKVGIRYKGNSTLRNAYSSNSDKFPFKLDFDEFEDEFPTIKNQRFYGFKQLNLSNNDSDGTFMREKLAADLFREFGVPSARTAFYAVFLDRGNGSYFIGIYTLIEEVDDSIPDSQFDDGDGNLYKPDGDAASFALGTYDESEMDLKTNEDIGDFSDVRALYDHLHDGSRTSNPNSWQTNLELIFNVDVFLRYLAVNNVIQNWDTYGVMTHNYFLYNEQSALTWIPWDNNESFQDGKQGGAISLAMTEVSSNWPLIRYIMDVDEYNATYKSYVNEFANAAFDPTKVSATIADYETVLIDYASLESSSFANSVSSLKNFVQSRYNSAINFSN